MCGYLVSSPFFKALGAGAVFKEITLDGAVDKIALLRRFEVNMLKQCNCGAPSLRIKLKKAEWNDNYRARAFFGGRTYQSMLLLCL